MGGVTGTYQFERAPDVTRFLPLESPFVPLRFQVLLPFDDPTPCLLSFPPDQADPPFVLTWSAPWVSAFLCPPFATSHPI